MVIRTVDNPFVVFDLDDTLFPEMEYLQSAFQEISAYVAEHTGAEIYDQLLAIYNQKGNPFQWLLTTFAEELSHCDVHFFLAMYRNHKPALKLVDDVSSFLKALSDRNISMGLITDGRSVSQRNKLKALGIDKYFSEIIISEEFGSEKPAPANYLHFEEKYPGHLFYFIGDNTSKDFIVPQKLGWKMICLKDKGYNIHKQSFDPRISELFVIASFSEIEVR